VKDEEGLNRYLLDRIAEKGRIRFQTGEELSGKKLVKLLSGIIKFHENLSKLSRRGYNRRFIEFLATSGISDKRAFQSKEQMDDLLGKMEEQGFRVSDVRWDEEDGTYEFVVTEMRNGGQSFEVDWQFLSSPELRNLISISEELGRYDQESEILSDNGEPKSVRGFQLLLEELMERAKKGLVIQRYKGLGEMNPQQLWATTMDPEKRTLQQVDIKDAVEADDIFTVLMGDKVEPRREFIQSNALEVTELDI
jgi:DNA gyrase subunit B